MGQDRQMDPEMRVTSSSGPKACTTCAKAKSRCTPGPTEEICERCHRLKKPCSSQTPAPPRKRKAPKPTRVAELEKRLADLTARVESRRPQPPMPANDASTVESERPQKRARRSSFPDSRAVQQRPGDTHVPAPDNPERLDHRREQLSQNHRNIPPKSNEDIAVRRAASGGTVGENGIPSRASMQQPQRAEEIANSTSASSYGAATASESLESQLQQQAISGRPPSKSAQWHRSFGLGGSSLGTGASETGDPWYYPSPDEAQQFLQDLNIHLVPLFPFVVVPPGMTSEALRRDRPLLWKAAMLQGLHLDARRQALIGDELLNDIVATSFLQPRKSFDLLQALEILLAWFHMSAKSFQLTNLLFLMRSICVSLGFNESQEFSKQQEHTVASLEQMRAFTGVYYLVTMVFTTNKKPDAFMNTTYLDHCCRVLEERREYPTDQLVVLLVRTQQIAQSISMTLAFRNNRDSLPLSLIVQSFQHEIRQLKDAIPESFCESGALKTQIHIAEILLYEAGLGEDLSAGLLPTDRLELLWECLNATKSMLQARFQKAFDGWPRSITLSSFDYTYAMLICLKLSLLQLPGWDLRLVRNELSFDQYLAKQIEDLQKFTLLRNKPHPADKGDGPTGRVPGPSEFQDPYERLHIRLTQLRICIMAELSASLPPDTQQTKDSSEAPQDANLVDGAVATPGSSMTAAFGGNFTDNPMQGLDDPFWQDFYKPNEWETNFSVLLGWGSDDMTGTSYATWSGDIPTY